MRSLNSGRGHTLQTSLSDEQAISCCRRLTESTFAQELVNKWDNYQRRHRAGRRAWPLSEAQLYWVHKFALEGDNPRREPDETAGDMAPIVQLFQNVSQHIRYPKIRLSLPADPAQPNGLRQPLALAWT